MNAASHIKWVFRCRVWNHLQPPEQASIVASFAKHEATPCFASSEVSRKFPDARRWEIN